ncbi:MAG TPA: hypothetical protein VJ691_03870, partial [Vicinamibacterales bacterium]|nr:hypothetical protein [Vicinamibacterales bacterium]
TSFMLALLTSLVGISCGPRLAPRIETADESQRQAYAAFWWNCVIVKSVDLTAACPSTCSSSDAASACSAGAADAQNQIAELEKKYGPERAQEILSLRIGEKDGYAQIAPYFPFGPTPEKARD